jgi:FKBP-type peptidyl-prolyl cis-trans isomerase
MGNASQNGRSELPSGIEIISERHGSGAVAARGATVQVRYTGRLHRGDVFQSDIVATFRIGDRRVIAGLEHAVLGMRVGGVREVQVPPHLGYRHSGVPGVIPPNALIFLTLELLAVLPGATETSTSANADANNSTDDPQG